MNNKKFTVGDRVRVTSTASLYYNSIGEVISVEPSGEPTISFHKSHMPLSFRKEDVELCNGVRGTTSQHAVA